MFPFLRALGEQGSWNCFELFRCGLERAVRGLKWRRRYPRKGGPDVEWSTDKLDFVRVPFLVVLTPSFCWTRTFSILSWFETSSISTLAGSTSGADTLLGSHEEHVHRDGSRSWKHAMVKYNLKAVRIQAHATTSPGIPRLDFLRLDIRQLEGHLYLYLPWCLRRVCRESLR